MRISGIYKIQSTSHPERCYIGSSKDIERHWGYHRMRLRKGVHENNKLQNHFNKYGENDFVYSFIKLCVDDEMLIAEQYFIDSYQPYFNICKTAGNTLGREPWNKGKKLDWVPPCAFKPGNIPWTKGRKYKLGNKRKPWSEEMRQKFSLAKMGNKNALKKNKEIVAS